LVAFYEQTKRHGAGTFWDILTGTLERSVFYGGK